MHCFVASSTRFLRLVQDAKQKASCTNRHKALEVTYRQEFFASDVLDLYLVGTAGASGFQWCIVRLQQRSFRHFFARSTLNVTPYGGSGMSACNDCSQ